MVSLLTLPFRLAFGILFALLALPFALLAIPFVLLFSLRFCCCGCCSRRRSRCFVLPFVLIAVMIGLAVGLVAMFLPLLPLASCLLRVGDCPARVAPAFAR